MRSGLLFLFALILPGTSFAQGEDIASGNYWVKLCKQADRQACLSFILGLREANSYDEYVRKVPQYCLPVGVTIDQMRKVILKFTDDHPDMLHSPFGALSIIALQQKFPCSPLDRERYPSKDKRP